MHTYKGNKGTIFNFNSDFSENICIKNKLGNEITIYGNDIIDFIAYCYILPKKIEKLEQSDSTELLC